MNEYAWSAVEVAPVKELFPGIRARPLWTGENGARAQVLEMEPGSRWDGVDVMTPTTLSRVKPVSDVFNDGIRDYAAGCFIHAPAGSSHVPQSNTGCTLFVFYPEG